jgi:TolA-binding protein|tara:strand:+ start:2603 stop:3445 length:843 start_codon:yes stop_codon:yes gene_type:complete
MPETEVLEQQPEETTPESELVEEVDGQAEGFDSPEGEAEGAPEQEEQLSDIDALVERMSRVETSTQDIDFIKHRVNSELSRVEGIQSRVDQLTNSTQAMASSDRIEQLEGTIAELTGLIMSSEMVDDATKIALREQQFERRLQDVEKGRASPEPVAEKAPDAQQIAQSQAWADATTYVAERAREMNIAYDDIPQEVLRAGELLGSPVRATDHVIGWIRAQSEGLEKVEQTAAKKRAAGNGTPTRSGTNTSIDDLVRSFGEGKDISTDEKRRVREHLGIKA